MEVSTVRFIDLFSGLGGFHLALQSLGHECVFACESDDELRQVYELNFGITPVGDIRNVDERDIPDHEILCAGFPCQPFSKAGEQLGAECPRWGDLFEKHVLRIIRFHKPSYVMLENVANLERHNGGNTWKRMRHQLRLAGYKVDAKILSPHRFGIPQIRERIFIVGSRSGLEKFKWPEERVKNLSLKSRLLKNPKGAKPLSARVISCLEIWQEFLDRSPRDIELPSFPIWTTEFGADYPYLDSTPFSEGERKLRKYRGSHGFKLADVPPKERFNYLPSYARTPSNTFPHWKSLFIRQNREFYASNRNWIDPWLPKILDLPASWQKFEWNCKGEERNIWQFIIQFRASGVRVKRPTTAPSLIAMTTTQVPIIASEKRYMTFRECKRIQDMDALRYSPKSETKAYKAFGNAVNVEIVKRVADALLPAPPAKNKNRKLYVSRAVQV